jgi:deoxyadenosine/deoxycytidine kinase
MSTRIIPNRIFCLAGDIGAGKSTVLRFLAEQYGYLFVPEYIATHRDAQKNLELFIHGDMKPYDFQRFVIRCTDEHFRGIPRNGAVLVMESSPFTSMLVFCKRMWDEHQITKMQYQALCDESKRVSEAYDIPFGYKKIIRIDDPAVEIPRYINRGGSSCIFLWRVSFELSFSRVQERKRPGEDKYDPAYLKDIHDRYDGIVECD